jgi:hypothetical protein
MSTLIEPVKANLGLSDFSVAFLSGALAFFYALSLMNGIGGTALLLLTLVLMRKLAKKDVRAVPLHAAASILLGTLPSILAYAAASRQVASAGRARRLLYTCAATGRSRRPAPSGASAACRA